MERTSLSRSTGALNHSKLKNITVSLSIKALEKKIVHIFLLSLMIPLSMPLGPVWSRIYFWDFSLVMIFFCWVTRISVERGPAPKLYVLDALLITFLLWLFLCNILGFRIDRSLEAWLLWVRGFFIYIYFSRNIGRIVQVKSFLVVVMMLIFLEGSLCIFQMITHSNIGQLTQYFGSYNPERVPTFWFQGEKYIRSPGTFFNTSIVASWMMLLLPILLVWNLYNKKKGYINIFTIVWIVGFIGAVTTLSRTKIINIVFGIFLILFLHPLNLLSGKIRRHHFYCFLIIALLIVGAGVFAEQTGYLKVISNRAQDFSGRFEKKIAYMTSAYDIINIKPILGTGQSNFGLLLEGTDFSYYHHGEGVVHNIPLLIGVESGLIGLFLFMLILTLMLFKWVKIRWDRLTEPYQVISAGSLVGILCMIIDMQFSATLIHHSLLPIFFVSLGVASPRHGMDHA